MIIRAMVEIRCDTRGSTDCNERGDCELRSVTSEWDTPHMFELFSMPPGWMMNYTGRVLCPKCAKEWCCNEKETAL